MKKKKVLISKANIKNPIKSSKATEDEHEKKTRRLYPPSPPPPPPPPVEPSHRLHRQVLSGVSKKSPAKSMNMGSSCCGSFPSGLLAILQHEKTSVFVPRTGGYFLILLSVATSEAWEVEKPAALNLEKALSSGSGQPDWWDPAYLSAYSPRAVPAPSNYCKSKNASLTESIKLSAISKRRSSTSGSIASVASVAGAEGRTSLEKTLREFALATAAVEIRHCGACPAVHSEPARKSNKLQLLEHFNETDLHRMSKHQL
ncbi:evolutionarily conserved C-terminal region 10 [Striga asiatica]|uniref:Evolutionarily conserved C-terminal region 10 n=1 Tax=Striga asiatica TaxID=4170 RepID=A0A5A7RB78_STRAF|nr:evolutionarily conserved C-terminal region 10 [Striga asiatica]